MLVTPENITQIQRDPDRPAWHICPPAGWMNDPNGTIFHAGYYHVFYQHHPYSDEWNTMHWGHVRSRDLLNWEHLPLALTPSFEQGEDHCFSGCVVLRKDHTPLLLYTSISSQRDAEQWAAIGSADLITWRKLPKPILTNTIHDPETIAEWRDPFVFWADDRAFLLLGGRCNERAVVLIYQAEDESLLQWQYRGVLFEHPDAQILSVECANFVRLRDKWVLLVSVYQHVEYYTGEFNPQTARFSYTQHGLFDQRHVYATNLLNAGQRTICFAWIRGFALERGWNGCLAVPRVLDIDPDGRLLQTPIGELQAMRQSKLNPTQLTEAITSSFEIQARIITPNQQAWQLILEPLESTTMPIQLIVTPETIQLNDLAHPNDLNTTTYELQLLLDRTVVEVFLNQRLCLTGVLPSSANTYRLRLELDAGAEVQILEGWKLS